MKIGCLIVYKKSGTFRGGAGIFEEAFIEGLKKKGHNVKSFYPTTENLIGLMELGTILMAASLSEHKYKAKKCDVLYATDYSGISYLDQEIPLVNVFHSTASGIFKIIGQEATSPGLEESNIWEKYAKEIEGLNLQSEYLYRKRQENIALIENFIARNSKYLVAVSERVKAEMVSYFHLPEDKITVIENGIPNQWFNNKNGRCPQCDLQVQRWKNQEKPVLVWVARIGDSEVNFKIKGLDRALEVMDHLDNVQKVVISFAPQPEQYQKLFASHGIEFISNWPYDHMPHLLRGADIFIQTSRYEGFGLTLAEAMASSLACISFPIGIATEIIKEDEKNGFLVSSTNEMIEKVNYLVQSPKERKEMGQKAAATAQRKCHLDIMLKKYLDFFKKIKK